ncbi:MAG TPA: LmeA family phospholipid-binding protein [Solirubrobacteraceae bacterium]|nr:LmeA family phospholipid-binding protein [Solirubrobacteraceae bacterium]
MSEALPGRARVVLLVAGAVVVVLALAQLILPRIAASMIGSKVGRYGKVQSVSVSSFPAIQILWGDVGSVRVHASSLTLSPAQVSSLLWEARGTGGLELHAERVELGSLALTDATLRKHGSSLSAEALASEASVQRALPAGVSVRLLHSGGGQVEVQATGSLFGLNASVNAVAGASDGQLVAHPLGFLIEAFQLTLFSSDHVYVEGVGASVHSHDPTGYRLTMQASLR